MNNWTTMKRNKTFHMGFSFDSTVSLAEESLNSTFMNNKPTQRMFNSTGDLLNFTTVNNSIPHGENSHFPPGSVEIKLSSVAYFAAFMLISVFIIGTVGNALTIWVFMFKKKRNRKRFEVLLSVLAITDLFSSIFVPALFLYGTLTQYNRWDFGYAGCKFISSLFPVSVTLSQGILILISYDRFRSMRNPFRKPLRKAFVFSWIFVTLGIACILVSPYYHSLEFVSAPMYGINTCVPAPNKSQHIFLYSIGNICRDFIATICLIVLGVLTNKALRMGGLLESTSVFKIRQKNTNKARKMLIVVACVFSCCVIPLDLFQVIVYTLFRTKVHISKEAYDGLLNGNTLLLILQVANSSTNFVIYSKMNRGFVHHVFACVRKGKHFARSSFRSTFRSMRTESVDSLSNCRVSVATELAITPNTQHLVDDYVFFPDANSSNPSKETTFHFTQDNDDINSDLKILF